METLQFVHKLGVGIASAAALASSHPGSAQGASSSNFRSEYRLTDQEKERILAAAEAKAGKRDVNREFVDLLDPPAIAGEVGFSIGTDGSRSAFGSAFYPFGSKGGATISIDMDRFGKIPQPLIPGNPNR